MYYVILGLQIFLYFLGSLFVFGIYKKYVRKVNALTYILAIIAEVTFHIVGMRLSLFIFTNQTAWDLMQYFVYTYVNPITYVALLLVPFLVNKFVVNRK